MAFTAWISQHSFIPDESITLRRPSKYLKNITAGHIRVTGDDDRPVTWLNESRRKETGRANSREQLPSIVTFVAKTKRGRLSMERPEMSNRYTRRWVTSGEPTVTLVTLFAPSRACVIRHGRGSVRSIQQYAPSPKVGGFTFDLV